MAADPEQASSSHTAMPTNAEPEPMEWTEESDADTPSATLEPLPPPVVPPRAGGVASPIRDLHEQTQEAVPIRRQADQDVGTA